MKGSFSLLAFRNRPRVWRAWQVLGVGALCVGLVACGRMAGKPQMPAEPTCLTVPTVTTAPTTSDDPEQASPADSVEAPLRAMILALTDPVVLVAPQGSLLPAEVSGDVAYFEVCDFDSTGDATDSDDDNYSVAETISFDYAILSFITVAVGGTGSLELMDKDDMDAASGVEVQAVSAVSMSVDGQKVFGVGSIVSLDVSPDDGAADYDVDFRGTAGIMEPFIRIAIRNKYDVTLTGSFRAGTMNGVGSVTTTTEPADCATVEESLREDCRLAVQTLESSEVELDVRTTDLQYDAVNCPTTFTGGQIDVRGAAGAIAISYSACGERSVTFSGQPPAGS
jgi:hypothetical protein